MFKLLTSAEEYEVLCTGFDRDRKKRQQEFTNKKIMKGKYPVRPMLKDVFGFAEHQEKASYGFVYRLKLTRNIDDVLSLQNSGN